MTGPRGALRPSLGQRWGALGDDKAAGLSLLGMALMAGQPSVEPSAERRTTGLLRVPFIRRCALEYEDGESASAFLVNINVLGAYIAPDKMPELGQNLSCRFQLPGSEREISVRGFVAWVNPDQQHPVHSLPPGFGLRFQQVSPQVESIIAGVVQSYVTRNSGAR